MGSLHFQVPEIDVEITSERLSSLHTTLHPTSNFTDYTQLVPSSMGIESDIS